MLKALYQISMPVDGVLLSLLYCYGALYISTHHKAVSGIRTGTLRALKDYLKQLKDYSIKVKTGEKIGALKRTKPAKNAKTT
jgi:hypothetical protein